jgi:hypothetical protein
VGLLLLALAGFLLGGLVALRRQGKPLGVQVVLGVGVAAMLWLAISSGTFG